MRRQHPVRMVASVVVGRAARAVAFVAVLCGVAGCASRGPDVGPNALSAKIRAQPVRLIVRFEGPAPLEALSARGEAKYPALGKGAATLSWASAVDRSLVVVESPRAEVPGVLARLKADGKVRYVVDDAVYGELALPPNDPSYPGQYAPSGPFKQLLEDAWSIQRTSDITIAVVDTGIAYDFIDLKNNIWQNLNEQIDGIDNDKNGIIDDRFGAEFVDPFDATSPPAKPGSEPRDFYGHGTAVASLAGAVGNNGEGLSGVVWSGRVMAIKIAAGSGGPSIWRLSDILAGIDYAVSNGARIINCSWLFRDDREGVKPLEDLIGAAPQCLFVVAAGNDGLDLDSTSGPLVDVWPAELPQANILTVGSSLGNDTRTPDSNWGAKSVDIFAPGVGHLIYEVTGDGSAFLSSGSGTSFSSPLVAGVCSLAWQRNPSMSAVQIKRLVMERGDVVAGLKELCLGKDGVGCTRLNPKAAVDTGVPPVE